MNLDSKPAKNFQIDPQITDLNVTLSVSEGVCESVIDTLVREKLSFYGPADIVLYMCARAVGNIG